MRRGSNAFGTLIPILLLGIVGMVAIPAALSRIRVHEEVAAVRALRRVGLAEFLHRARTGRFGFLPELRDPARDGVPPLALDLEVDRETGTARVGPYRIAILLPDERWNPVDPLHRSRVSPEHAKSSFRAVAWPFGPRPGARRIYVLRQDLVLLEHPGPCRTLGGPEPPRLKRIPMKPRTPDTERDPVLPPPWHTTVRRETEHWFARRLTALGLPLPPTFRGVDAGTEEKSPHPTPEHDR